VDWLLSVPLAYRLAITLAFVGVVAGLSIAPGVERSGDSLFVWLVVHTATPVQKTMHVAVYALLTVLWVWTLQAIESWLPKLLLAFALSLSIGVALEWYQMSVPGRFGTITDVLLNGIGVIAGLIIAFFLL
jgi:hypothetical protein